MVKLMKSLSDIYSLIEDENIVLEDVCFKSSNIEGIYFKVSEMNPIIGIHKNIKIKTIKILFFFMTNSLLPKSLNKF